MIRFYLLFVLVVGCLVARENPFEPIIKPREDNIKPSEAKEYFLEREFRLPSTARILKEITITYQNLDGTIESKNVKVDESIDWHYPISVNQKGAILAQDSRHFVLKPFEFFTQGNKFYLYSQSNLIRSFVLPSPYRIVLDFPRTDLEANGASDILVKYFTKASIGTHKDFYRFVITLDGQYSYDISRDDERYIISVN